jgi:hypothetical protein
MDEEKFLKKLKIYRAIVALLIGTLFVVIGYSYTLRLDINYLQTKVKEQHTEIDIIKNSYIRNINQWIWKQQLLK